MFHSNAPHKINHQQGNYAQYDHIVIVSPPPLPLLTNSFVEVAVLQQAAVTATQKNSAARHNHVFFEYFKQQVVLIVMRQY